MIKYCVGDKEWAGGPLESLVRYANCCCGTEGPVCSKGRATASWLSLDPAFGWLASPQVLHPLRLSVACHGCAQAQLVRETEASTPCWQVRVRERCLVAERPRQVPREQHFSSSSKSFIRHRIPDVPPAFDAPWVCFWDLRWWWWTSSFPGEVDSCVISCRIHHLFICISALSSVKFALVTWCSFFF